MSDDELDLVRSIATDTAEPDAVTTQAARARLLAVIAAEAAPGPAPPTRRRAVRAAGRVRLRRLLPASAAVAAVLTAALAAPLLLQRPATVPPAPGTRAQPHGSLPSPEPTADSVLTAAARAAARVPAPRFGPGRYWYVRERGVKLGTNLDQAGSQRSFFYRFGYRSETWWALDGSLAGQLRNGPAEFLDEGERAAWIAAGRPDLGLPNTEVYSPKVKQRVVGIGWLPASYQDLVELPTDPARLLAALTERVRTHQPGGLLTGSPSRTQALFGTIGYLLEHYPLPPQLRAGLYQVLTRLDGVKLVGNVTDLAGRPAMAVAIDVDGLLHERSELLLEPASGRLLGARSVLARRVHGWRLPAGTVLEERVFLRASVVDSRNARP